MTRSAIDWGGGGTTQELQEVNWAAGRILHFSLVFNLFFKQVDGFAAVISVWPKAESTALPCAAVGHGSCEHLFQMQTTELVVD